MTSEYNPGDYERVRIDSKFNQCKGCVFDIGIAGCAVELQDEIVCCEKGADGNWIDYIFVVKNAKAEKGGK